MVTNKMESGEPTIYSNLYYKKLFRDVKKYKWLYLMLFPVILDIVIFSYLPMYGMQIAFRRYNIVQGISGSPWVGMKYFMDFFNSYSFVLILRNTLILSFSLLIFGFPLPILFALLLNEVRGGIFKKISQTISYLPYFISAVVVVGMVLQFLSPSGGPVNLLLSFFGKEPVYFLGEPEYFRITYIIMMLWRSTGFGAIIYIAAITSLDYEMYESAIIDGAGRFKRMIYITLPCIRPTIITLFILGLGGIMNLSWMEILLMKNPLNREVSEVIQTFVYQRGIIDANYSYGAAVGMVNSIVGFLFVLGFNALAKRFSETSLF